MVAQTHHNDCRGGAVGIHVLRYRLIPVISNIVVEDGSTTVGLPSEEHMGQFFESIVSERAHVDVTEAVLEMKRNFVANQISNAAVTAQLGWSIVHDILVSFDLCTRNNCSVLWHQ